MTGALLPVGVPAKPGMIIKAQVPCGGSVMRVKMTDQGADGIYPHEKMEVYAMGFRNQAGVAFGPAGTKWANALAVTDNGANDLGHRRIANAPEKLFIVTQQGQDAGFPDKEGFGFVTNKRFAWQAYRGNPVDRPLPQLYIGDKPFVPKMVPYKFQFHVDGVRGVPLIAANPNPNGYINPVLEWDTNNPIDGIAWSARNFGADNNLCSAPSTAFSTPARRASSRLGRWCCASSSSSRQASNGLPLPRISSRARTPIRSRKIAVVWSGPTRSCSATMDAPCMWSTTVRYSPTSN